MPTAPSQRFRAGLCLTLLWQGDVLHAQRFPKPRVIRVGPDGDLTLPADACGGGLCLASVDHKGHFALHLDAPGLAGVAVIDGRPHEVGVPGGPHRMRLGPGRHATLELGEFTLLVASVSPPARSLWAPWEGDGAPILFGLGLAQRALQAEPGLRVRAVLAFFVGPDGAVRSVRVRPGRGPAPDAALSECLAAASRVMRFPAATDGGSTRVELPLRFTPR